ncbi:hypothetical protein WICPIJ_008002 [Wickerhamomyces pijperi]|uniref:Nuclear fusion protein KAR5 n=1 Tax=Wickerhamomyces pijperi TaxID=599730 RepID=A0A9P8Q198_WICPI|nr:hypothetical protein WICPIJ_008002 [Wickerhamomyces pijperi]
MNILIVSFVYYTLFTAADSKDSSSDVSAYSLQDILHRHRNITTTKQDVLVFNLRPEYNDNQCVKTALSPILSQCLKTSINDLDPSLRAHTAASLSLCEFQIAQISHPLECSYDTVDDECVKAMERKAQWWTSYSGYYRSLGEICMEENANFEQERILEVYFKITEYYQQMMAGFQEQVDLASEFRKESMSGFDDLKKQMDDLNETSQENEKLMKLIWLNLMSELEKMNEVTLNVTDVMVKSTRSMEDELYDILETVNDEVSYEMTLLKDKFSKQLEQNQEVTMEYFNVLQGQLQYNLEINNENSRISAVVNRNLRESLFHSDNLHGSMSNITDTMSNLTDTISLSHSQILQIHEIVENNSIIRFLNHMVTNLNMKLIMSLRFCMMVLSITLLLISALVIVCNISAALRMVFQMIGILSVSLGLALIFGLTVVSFGDALRSKV